MTGCFRDLLFVRHTKRRLGVAVYALTSTLTASVVSAASDEVRGTWVTTTGYTTSTSTIYNAATTNANFAALRSIGLNSIYMDIWRNGYTYFRSPTNAAITGSYTDPGTGSRDILADTVLQAHRNQMSIFGWFQYGTMASYGNPSASNTTVSGYMKSNGWLLQDSSGAYTNSSTGFTWMNPLVPQVKTYVTNMLLDAVRKYNLQGIQLDDHIGWPVQFGYDNYTKAQYLAETGKALPSSYTDSAFTAWRTAKVTSFMQSVTAALRAARPSLIISDSPPLYPFSANNYCEDWPTWQKMGLFDEYVPQNYVTSSSAFTTNWSGTGGVTSKMGGKPGTFAGGVAINTSSGLNDYATVTQPSLNTVRATSGIKGEVLWYSDGVLQNQANLTSYYNVAGLGQANRPDVSASTLLAPVEGASTATTQWQFTVTQGQYYDLIAANGSTWRTQQSAIYLAPGTYSFAVSSATQAELLESAATAINGPLAGQWSANAGGSWSVDTNWSNLIVPDGSGATATLSTVPASGSIVLDSNRTLGHLIFNSSQSCTISAGGGSLTIDNSGPAASGSPGIVVSAGSHVLAAPLALGNVGATITTSTGTGINMSGPISGTGSLTVAGTGSVLLSNSNTYAGGTTISGGLLSISNANALGSGSISVTAGTLRLALPSNTALRASVDHLSITGNGKVDLTGNAMILDYTAGQSQASYLENLRLQLGNKALYSSTLASNQAVGYGDNAGLGYASFAGQNVAANDLLVMPTYVGDTNLDGKVDIADLGILASHWQQAAGWTGGDFDYSGLVDIGDLGALASNWQVGVAASSPDAISFAAAMQRVGLGDLTSEVPEPSAGGVLFLLITIARCVCRPTDELVT